MDVRVQQAETFGLPVNQETAFSTPKGKFKESIKRQQLALLAKYKPLLKQILEPGEEILLAMHGCSPVRLLGQLATGWICTFIKQCAFVVTNKRILHFPSKGSYDPKHSIAQIRYGDVQMIKASTVPWRKFTVNYKNGTKETFLSVKEVRKLRAMLPSLRLQGEETSLFRVRHHLCPKCTAPLEPNVYTCWKCGLEFRSMKKAVLLSIFLPGGGYFYTGHALLGMGDAIAEVILLYWAFVSLMNVLFGTADPVHNLFIVTGFGAILFFKKLITIHHARHYVKEYIPVDTHFQRAGKD